MSAPVSVVIDNFDNARFLPTAIDSALAQRHEPVEVVVVDDGSGDDSLAVLDRYRNDVTVVAKPNGGQASALNRGIAASHGKAVILLDSDDVLVPTAAATLAAELADPAVTRVQWPMRVIDDDGRPTGEVDKPGLGCGDLRETLLRAGPFAYAWAPTSGNAWSRRLLDAVTPIPEAPFRLDPDLYLAALSPLYGEVAVVAPQSCWRRHGSNHGGRASFDVTLRRRARRYEHCLDAARRHARALGLRLDVAGWRANNWFGRIGGAVDDILRVVPTGGRILLADGAAWGVPSDLRDRTWTPLPEHDGAYAGPPADATAALDALERGRASGARFLALAWPAFWWLEAYPLLATHLDTHATRVSMGADLMLYEL